MKSIGPVIFSLALATSALAAETAHERGKRVVNEALQAVGGKAFLAMEDRVESGRAYSFFRQELEGLSIAKIYTRYVTAGARDSPPSANARISARTNRAAACFSTRTARGRSPSAARACWSRSASKTGGTARLRNIFYILRQRLNEPGMDFYSRGSDLYENLPVEIVDITDSNGLTVTVYFSASTKLPVRQVLKRRNPEYKDFDTEETIFAKYRDVGGGVMWPFSIRRSRNGEKLYEIYSESVQINKNLKDDLFTLPAKLKILPPAK